MLVEIDTDRADVFNFVCVKVGKLVAIIDPEDAERICAYTWYPKRAKHSFYAVRKKRDHGSEFLVYMHRQITHCPNHLVVHHKNHHTLDNRKQNLPKMTRKEHTLIHQFH